MVYVMEQEVNEEEATQLMMHHLRLAASYFEATHKDSGWRANILIKEKMQDDWSKAASAFVNALCASYEEMKK